MNTGFLRVGAELSPTFQGGTLGYEHRFRFNDHLTGAAFAEGHVGRRHGELDGGFITGFELGW